MHVHGSWSEQAGSWESQCAQAAALGIQVLWPTDHDFRALAYNYLTSLTKAILVKNTSGALAQSTTSLTNGVVRVLAQSSGSAAASVTMAIQTKPMAWNQLRTSISGQSLVVGFPSSRIDSGGTYEIVVALSNHPAYGTRPAGQFYLRYRFGSLAQARFVDSSGLVGIVTNPTPLAGAQTTLNLTSDVAALWPDMLAIDNTFGMLSFVATSPNRGTVVDVQASVQFVRTRNDQASIIADQKIVFDKYGSQYPNMSIFQELEISRLDPHCNVFGVAQFFPDQSLITPTTHDSYYLGMVANVHAQGGLVSLNHPFGAQGGPLQSATQQATTRRNLFTGLKGNGRFGTDLMEVGYPVRGFVGIQAHLDLWDTFSRWAIFITGNGVNDDHDGLNWSTLVNGFSTGIWATSVAEPDLMAALASGRVFTSHSGQFPGARLDLLVDGTVPMGKVSVASTTSRSLAIYTAGLPTGSKVEVVQGPVDYTSSDPGTLIAQTLPATSFSGSGVASVIINTSASTFVRIQVRNSSGAIIGVSNPVWLLQAPPPAGIPAARIA
jgi:hypothetical protein